MHTQTTPAALATDWPDPQPAVIDAFRACGCGRFETSYTAMLETPGPEAILAVLRTAQRDGHLASVHTAPSEVAALGVYDAADDLIIDYLIPTEPSWDWWVTAAGLRATATDCPTCDPRHLGRAHLTHLHTPQAGGDHP